MKILRSCSNCNTNITVDFDEGELIAIYKEALDKIDKHIEETWDTMPDASKINDILIEAWTTNRLTPHE